MGKLYLEMFSVLGRLRCKFNTLNYNYEFLVYTQGVVVIEEWIRPQLSSFLFFEIYGVKTNNS